MIELWPWKKKKDPEKVAVQAIEAIRDEAVGQIRRIGSSYNRVIDGLGVHLSRVVARFEQHINDLLISQETLKPLDDEIVRGENTYTADFPDLDSRAVFAGPGPKIMISHIGMGYMATVDEAMKAVMDHHAGDLEIKNIEQVETWLEQFDE